MTRSRITVLCIALLACLLSTAALGRELNERMAAWSQTVVATDEQHPNSLGLSHHHRTRGRPLEIVLFTCIFLRSRSCHWLRDTLHLRCQQVAMKGAPQWQGARRATRRG